MTQPNNGARPTPKGSAKNWNSMRLRLLKREREVNSFMRTLAELNRWSAATVSLASAISACVDGHEAVQKLASVLVDELGFDYARVVWEDSSVEYPDLAEQVEVDCVARLARIASSDNVAAAGDAAQNPSDAPFGAPIELRIPTSTDSTSGVYILAAYRRERLSYIDANAGRERLSDLTSILEHPFSSLRLRLALMAERDALQEKVASATSHLRRALARADTARVAAERSAQVRNQFLAHMSHEIRTPLTAILAYAELLFDDAAAGGCKKLRHNAGVIMGSGRHLLQLLNDILDLARIESGHFALEPVRGSVPQLLMDVASLMRVRAVEAGLVLKVEFLTPIPTLSRLDFPRLRQILINIVGNAIKFTNTGSVEVRASVDRHEDARQHTLTIEVEDTGIGIAPEALAHIFEDFRTGNDSNTAKQPGTGLGLAISQRLAKLMDGTIEVATERGSGSCFAVRVKLEALQGTRWISAPETLSKPPSGPYFVPTSTFAGRALLAEDTKHIGLVVAEWLRRLGLTVDFVNDGQEACDAVMGAHEPYDIIFMDMQMPRLNGYQAARRLRDEGVTTPIVALTAHAMAGERERCIRAGCTEHIAKPVDRARLFHVIEAHMKSESRKESNVPSDDADDVIAELMGAFYVDLAEKRRDIASALDEGDSRRAAALAHMIAGAAFTFGVPDLGTCARDFEQSTRASNGEAAQELGSRLMRDIDRALSARNEVGSIPPAG